MLGPAFGGSRLSPPIPSSLSSMVTPLPRLRVSNASIRPDTEPLASRCVINANAERKRVSIQIVPASFKSHQRVPAHCLGAELGGGAEVGDQPDIVEPRPPAPFHVRR